VDLQPLISDIVTAHRERCFWMDQRIALDNNLHAYLRLNMGWKKKLPRHEGDRIKAAAKRVVELGVRYKRDLAKAIKKSGGNEDQGLVDTNDVNYRNVPMPPELAPYAGVVLDMLAIREIPVSRELEPTEQMLALAKQLPVWPLVKDWRGFGELSLAIIVAEQAGEECGGLDRFPTKGKFFIRMGVGVKDGIRQGGLPKGAPKALWEKHKYNRRRRSRSWQIASSMLMLGNERFRALYDTRKAYEVEVAQAVGLIIRPSAKIPKKGAEKYRSLKHIDLRARRWAEQHILCDLWRAWNRAQKLAGEDHR
jgi:hypothetical protein